MPKNKPQQLIIKYSDGTTREVEFSELSSGAQAELSRLGGATLGASSSRGKYLLLRWKDGWQEVLRVEEECVELLKYYVLERAEAVGRIVVSRSGPYPAVKVIGRKPGELEKVALTDGKDTKTYILAGVEGTRVEGGRTEYYYKVESAGANYMEEITGQLKKALGDDGTEAKELLARSDTSRIEDYETLRKQIRLKANKRQEDVLTFIDMTLQTLSISPAVECQEPIIES